VEPYLCAQVGRHRRGRRRKRWEREDQVETERLFLGGIVRGPFAGSPGGGTLPVDRVAHRNIESPSVFVRRTSPGRLDALLLSRRGNQALQELALGIAWGEIGGALVGGTGFVGTAKSGEEAGANGVVEVPDFE
jgi:hypothetical protein